MRTSALAFFALTVSCSVRGAGLSDLVDEVKTTPAGSEAGSDTAPRLDVKCDPVPPAAEASKTVPVAASTFGMGCNAQVDQECRKDELPPHSVALAAFEIDVTEVTQAQYYDCVHSGVCAPPSCDWDPCVGGKRRQYPVVCVNHADAVAYCTWKGMRLPTEAEWEKAARGEDRRKYPWGNDGVDCAHANILGCTKGTMPPGTLAAGASPYGALDMAGNVVEWVLDFYDAAYYATSPASEPKGPAKASRYVGRGGGWRSEPVWHRTSQRDDYEPGYLKDTLGFRCVK